MRDATLTKFLIIVGVIKIKKTSGEYIASFRPLHPLVILTIVIFIIIDVLNFIFYFIKDVIQAIPDHYRDFIRDLKETNDILKKQIAVKDEDCNSSLKPWLDKKFKRGS